MTTAATIKRELEKMQAVFTPKENERMGIDRKRLPKDVDALFMQCAHIYMAERTKWRNDANKHCMHEFDEYFSKVVFPNLPKEQQQLFLKQEEMWNQYAEPERVIRKRNYVPIH